MSLTRNSLNAGAGSPLSVTGATYVLLWLSSFFLSLALFSTTWVKSSVVSNFFPFGFFLSLLAKKSSKSAMVTPNTMQPRCYFSKFNYYDHYFTTLSVTHKLKTDSNRLCSSVLAIHSTQIVKEYVFVETTIVSIHAPT